MVDFHMESPERCQAKMGNFDARGAGKPRVHHTGPGRVQRQLQHKVALTLCSSSTTTETLPPGVPSLASRQSHANGTSSESATALAAIMKGDLVARKIFRFWYGSAACRAWQSSSVCGLAQDDNVENATVRSTTTAIVDSGVEIHVVCPAHRHLMTHVTQQQEPLQLETVGGDLSLDTVSVLICGGVVCRGGLFNSPAQNWTDTSMRGAMMVMACCDARVETLGLTFMVDLAFSWKQTRKLLHVIQCSCLARWNVDKSAGRKMTLNICGETSGFRPRMHHMHVHDHASSAIRTSGRRGDGRHGKRSLR